MLPGTVLCEERDCTGQDHGLAPDACTYNRFMLKSERDNPVAFCESRSVNASRESSPVNAVP